MSYSNQLFEKMKYSVAAISELPTTMGLKLRRWKFDLAIRHDAYIIKQQCCYRLILHTPSPPSPTSVPSSLPLAEMRGSLSRLRKVVWKTGEFGGGGEE
jgi:hypothetical protein